MTPEQFAYWLQGFAELNQGQPTPEQWQSIRDHLATVFTKVTPPYQPFQPLTSPFIIPTEVTCREGKMICSNETFLVDFNSLPRFSAPT